ncbi:FliG C-terminal domain-containing protein [Thiomicrorhabdus xiamenensis]|uniref:Flagellar motor switch protein FliG C-terminal domain-containing protein n=1 Tax=Thiomicrorhabdus xiamenensis TaxID=2739063 RepID=A0A7D4T9G3_9GAMM|nr:FliG C-terminal domain-containing protein [Thiomicrorhabdus xiamenensis]QKI88526.1 hypothetical protein HQN79_02520 [Thiomicrorhabdus xiamenensis]
MEISAKHDESGEFLLEIGPVMFTLPYEVVESLHDVIAKRLSAGEQSSHAVLQKKLESYRTLANKMAQVDDRVVQKFAPLVSPEQLVTITRLASGEVLYNKVMRNLSKQNQRQFAEDYAAMDKITEAHACLYMEQLIPMIKRAAQEQKQIHEQLQETSRDL